MLTQGSSKLGGSNKSDEVTKRMTMKFNKKQKNHREEFLKMYKIKGSRFDPFKKLFEMFAKNIKYVCISHANKEEKTMIVFNKELLLKRKMTSV